MFFEASRFNQPLSFDTSSVTDMEVRSVRRVYCISVRMARLTAWSLTEGVSCAFADRRGCVSFYCHAR